jgi:hypothetical protein
MSVSKVPFHISVFTESEYTMVAKDQNQTYAKDIASALSRHIFDKA